MSPTSAAKLNDSGFTPTQAGQRIVDIDILRGFALFGILIVNIFYFNAPDKYYGDYFGQFTDPINSSIFHAVNYLFTGRFYPIFSFLFGFGFFIQFTKLKRKGAGAYGFFARRMFILLLFGVAHILFVWEEDILLFYALFGFVLLPLAERSPRFVFVTATIAFFSPVIFDVVATAVQYVPKSHSAFDSLPAYIEFYRTATYAQIMQLRLAVYETKLFDFAGLISHFDRLAFFLYGLYAGKLHFFTHLSENKKLWARWWVIAFVVMTLGILSQVTWLKGFDHSGDPLLVAVSGTIANISRFAQVFTYVVGFLLLVNIKAFRQWLMVFAGPGRTALTIYLMHTTVFALLFYSYGLKQYGAWNPLQLLLGAVGLFAIQIILSNLWLRYFAYGPLEWIWRSLTYKRILPIRREGNAQAGGF